MRDIGEARLEIEDTLTLPPDGLVTPNAERRTPNDEPRRAWRHTLPWAVAAAALGAAAVLTLWAPWRADKLLDRPLVRLDVDLGADVSLPAPISAGAASRSPPMARGWSIARAHRRSCSSAGWINHGPTNSREHRARQHRSSRRIANGWDSCRVAR